jgi:hypothetical protein
MSQPTYGDLDEGLAAGLCGPRNPAGAMPVVRRAWFGVFCAGHAG